MKNPDRVAELIAALESECEYHAEFDAVAALKQTVSELPRVTVLDDDHQEFRGKIYNKTPSGHYSKGRYIHRDVWIWYHGDIPKGYQIHHIDFDPANNDIENLQCLPTVIHRQIHLPKGEQIPKPLRTFICEECGKEYQTYATGNNRFCSEQCRSKNEYRTQPQVEKICPVCGKKFITRRDNGAVTCSRSCGNKLKHHGAKTVAVCEVCGKTFSVNEAHSSRFCSRKCKSKRDYERAKVNRTCVICGKIFSCYKYDATVTCSPSCARKLSWQKRHANKVAK